MKKWPFLVVTILVLLSLVFGGCSSSSKKEYSLTMSVSGKGSVYPSAGTHTYKEGAVLQVFVMNVAGWKFDGWSGDASGNNKSISLRMDGDKAITANFSQIIYNLAIAVDGNGTTDPQVGVHTYDAGTVVRITATPTNGWKFDHWSGDKSGPNATVDISMNSNKSVTANFSTAPR